MLILSIINLTLFFACEPLIIDSIIYSVDLSKMEVREQTIPEHIIDYSIDDFLFVVTNRYLYKIDPDYLTINDRIPLPQNYNYLVTNKDHIILITSGEVIILDKANLGFKTGIGIEYGDHRPMLKPRLLNIAEKNRVIYLVTESGGQTIMKILSLDNGRILKKKSVNSIVSYEYDPEHNTLTTFDIDGRLSVYDTHLNRKAVTDLSFSGQRFSRHENGYLIYKKQGIFFVSRTGTLIDFQPIAVKEGGLSEKFTLLTDHGIVYLDSLTLRTKNIFQTKKEIVKLFQIHSDNATYVVALDRNRDFHLLDMNAMVLKPMIRKKRIIKKKIPISLVASTDSLWYFQVGAFVDYENALEMCSSIKEQQHIPVFIDSTDLYRVKFGGFQDKTRAIGIVEKTELNGWFVFQNRIQQQDSIEFYVDVEKYILEDGIIKGSGL